jgi:hypothetical protein
MESEAVAAVRRRLEGQAREHTERLELASRQLAETRKRTEETNAKFVHDVHRLVQRLRESNAARKAAGRSGPGTLSFDAEDVEPDDAFPGSAPRRTEGGPADDEQQGSVLQRAQQRPLATPPPAPAEPQRPTPPAPPPHPAPPRRVPPRRPAAGDSDDDFSGQTWLR